MYPKVLGLLSYFGSAGRAANRLGYRLESVPRDPRVAVLLCGGGLGSANRLKSVPQAVLASACGLEASAGAPVVWRSLDFEEAAVEIFLLGEEFGVDVHVLGAWFVGLAKGGFEFA